MPEFCPHDRPTSRFSDIAADVTSPVHFHFGQASGTSPFKFYVMSRQLARFFDERVESLLSSNGTFMRTGSRAAARNHTTNRLTSE